MSFSFENELPSKLLMKDLVSVANATHGGSTGYREESVIQKASRKTSSPLDLLGIGGRFENEINDVPWELEILQVVACA